MVVTEANHAELLPSGASTSSTGRQYYALSLHRPSPQDPPEAHAATGSDSATASHSKCALSGGSCLRQQPTAEHTLEREQCQAHRSKETLIMLLHAVLIHVHCYEQGFSSEASVSISYAAARGSLVVPLQVTPMTCMVAAPQPSGPARSIPASCRGMDGQPMACPGCSAGSALRR